MSVKVLKRALPDLAILFLVLIVYLPAFHAGFIWDDDAHLTENRYITGPGGLREIWTSSAATYYPLVLTTFWIQHALWGFNPLPYHLINIVMHALCAILFRHVLLNLRLNPPAAWCGAVFWAIHPVQAESVAWITELKNTQSGVFYLAAILLFFRWRNSPQSNGRLRLILYILFLLSAALALLSKTSTVMLPVILALSAWWIDGRWDWKLLRALSPFFVISAAAGAWTIWEQKFHSGAVGSEWTQRFSERVIIAGYSVWFYLGKLIWPYPLSFVYPRWAVNVGNPLSYLPALGVAIAILVLWRFRNGKFRGLFFAALYFVISLFPVLNFFDIYFFRYSFVGDHFQYLASMGPLAFAGAAIVHASINIFDPSGAAKRRQNVAQGASPGTSSPSKYQPRRGGILMRITKNLPSLRDSQNRSIPFPRPHGLGYILTPLRGLGFVESLISATVVLILAILTAQHAAVFQSNETLWRDTIARNDGAWLAHNNLATIFLDRGDAAAAEVELETTLRLQPNDAEAHANLANIFFEAGRFEEAATQFQLALLGEPDYARIHDYLGVSLMETGRLEEGMPHMRRSVEIDPNNSTAREHLGLGLWRQGNIDQAMSQFAEGVRVDPAGTAPRMRYGTALLTLKRYAEAQTQFLEILRHSPDFEPAHKFLGIALSGLHQKTEAIRHLEEAVRLDPDDAEAKQKLEEIQSSH